MGRDLVNLSHFFLPGDTKTRPGKHLENTWSAKIECDLQLVAKLNAKLNARSLPNSCRFVNSTPVLYELGFTRCLKLNIIPYSQFECLTRVAYSRLPLLESHHLLDLTNLKSYVQFAVDLFSKPH